MTLPDPVQRALRTFIQAFITAFLGFPALSALAPGTVPPTSLLVNAALAASFAGATAVLSWLHNQLEQSNVLPPVLKSEPESPKAPPAA